MLGGIFLIIAGILIAVYPPLLSLIVAVVMMFIGAMVVAIAYYNRKHRRHFENPAIELFFRF